MALILPKGIVVNSENIGGELQSFGDAPLDVDGIAQMWKVYTTTTRRLKDPTARRLESFWWRIWGSRSKGLNGATVADLFAHISHGPTFVPLFSPAPRDEGTPSLTKGENGGSRATSVSRPRLESNVEPSSVARMRRKPMSDGNPSMARFVSPAESPVSSVSPQVVIQPPSPDTATFKTEKRTGGVGLNRKGHGHVVSTGTKKKRPLMVRRKSSQSSGDRELDPCSSEQPTSSKGKTPAKSKFQENFSPPVEKSTRKKDSSKPSDSKRATTQRKDKAKSEERLSLFSGDPGPSTIRDSAIAKHSDEFKVEEFAELPLQQNPSLDSNARAREHHGSDQHVNQEDNLNSPEGNATLTNEYGRESEGMGNISHALKNSENGTSSGKNNAITAECLDSEGDKLNDSSEVASGRKINKGKGTAPAEVEVEDMFAKRPVPSGTASGSSASLSMARSKSQLTLLLRKDDRTRSGERMERDKASRKE